MMKRSKYGAVKKEVDWIKFDSWVEEQYYIYLKNLWINFEIHPKYLLQEKFIANDGSKIQEINYIADFSYGDTVVDIKWLPTEGAKLKRKLFMYRYPELKLQWLVKFQNQWVDYFENEKRKKLNKKQKSLVVK